MATRKKSKTEVRFKLDDITLLRHKELYVIGDYNRIAEMVKTGEKEKVETKRITECIEQGFAKESIAKAITRFYANKASKAKAQKALTSVSA